VSPVYIEVEAEVRYWEDASVNGEDDESGTLMPFRFADKWCPVIRLSDGWIVGWPEGTEADVHYKVCDAGEYWLAAEEGRIAKWAGGYVPDEFLCHGEAGYGDYIIMKIGKDGRVKGWESPRVQWARREGDGPGWAPLETTTTP
jgi:hypothetical protein